MIPVQILKHEWRMLKADRSLWAILCLLVILISYAVYNGISWVNFQRKTLESIRQDDSERIRKLRTDLTSYESGKRQPRGSQDPRSSASVGGTGAASYLKLPPAPLAALSIGQGDLDSYYVKAGLRTRQMNASSEEIENPVNLLTGHFDLAFVIVYLYPLLILALSYNLISAEKERGTLALTLSQPVALRSIVAGKIVFRAAVLAGLTIAISPIAMMLSGANLGGAGVLTGWLLWVSIVLSYGAFWFAVALAVNSLGKSSAANAVACSAVWLAVVLVTPSLINAAASSFYPIPSRVEMIQAMRVATKEATERGSVLLGRYMEDHPDLMPASAGGDQADFTNKTYAVQMEVDRLVQQVADRFDRQSSLQQGVVDRFRFLSPAILAQGALNDVSGTSAARQRNFIKQVDAFLSVWQKYFYPRIFRKVNITVADLDRLPQFEYLEEPGIAIAGRIALAVVGILIGALVFGLPAVLRISRYPVAG